ncbi:hypothetical protein AQ610_18315 (plasmid) [Burkholderia humptydooensis]|nr:hypothetical protein AQ610_18315 [Burkholderia humptydooensis]
MHLHRIVFLVLLTSFAFLSGCAALHICGPFDSYEEGIGKYVDWQAETLSAYHLGVEQARDQCKDELIEQCVVKYVELCRNRSDERFRNMSKADADHACARVDPFIQEPGMTCERFQERADAARIWRSVKLPWQDACGSCAYEPNAQHRDPFIPRADARMFDACMVDKGFKLVTKTSQGTCEPHGILNGVL